MAICSRCGKEYDPAEAAEEFASDSYISEHDLGYTYASMEDRCADCAIDFVLDSYPQGLEDLSYRWGDDS